MCLESNFSQPFIVKTNENQWEESEGILLKMETFGDALETSWCQFANTLQKRYLAATKQDIQKPTRPLSVQDINYLYQLKFASNILSLSLSQVNQTELTFNGGSYFIKLQPNHTPYSLQQIQSSLLNNSISSGNGLVQDFRKFDINGTCVRCGLKGSLFSKIHSENPITNSILWN
jgi:hypothetical protein